MAGKLKNAQGYCQSSLQSKYTEEEERVIVGVKQKLGSIMQKNTFLAEDVQRMDDEEEESADEGSSDEDVDYDEEQEQEQDEPLSWNDVFGENGDGVPTGESSKSNVDKEVSSEEETESRSKKEPRMKTNKKKAMNFYTNSNVKNKNRNRSALLKSLPVGKKGERRKQRKDVWIFRFLPV